MYSILFPMIFLLVIQKFLYNIFRSMNRGSIPVLDLTWPLFWSSHVNWSDRDLFLDMPKNYKNKIKNTMCQHQTQEIKWINLSINTVWQCIPFCTRNCSFFFAKSVTSQLQRRHSCTEFGITRNTRKFSDPNNQTVGNFNHKKFFKFEWFFQ